MSFMTFHTGTLLHDKKISSEFYAKYNICLNNNRVGAFLCCMDAKNLPLDIEIKKVQINQNISNKLKKFEFKIKPLMLLYDTGDDMADLSELANIFEFNSNIKLDSGLTLVSELSEIIINYAKKIKKIWILESSARNLDKLLKGTNFLVPVILISLDKINYVTKKPSK